MRPKVLLFVLTYVLVAGSSVGSAQLPPEVPELPQAPQLPEVPAVPPLPLPDTTEPVEEAAKQVEDATTAPATSPPPVGASGEPAPAGGGSGGDRSGSAETRGAGTQAEGGTASYDGISHRCPGEGILGGGSVGRTLTASSQGGVGGQATGEGALGTATTGESGGPVGAFVEAAGSASLRAWAILAFGALLLLVGLGGGLRALQGRLRSG